MTEPSRPRPVPGPPRPGPGPTGGPAPVPDPTAPLPVAPRPADDGARFADLQQRPVAEHVAVFAAEHARLQRELATIDQL
ncbi:hypothetical protein DQ238_12170 [Geodermatophilus sp. TF02-6]|uniref:hypothetical protein n=1 Tax=Geodermatophilus sp. TF02-6 TaxID=2250575 RepID=UPI000DEAACE4|nr:hypothetical protein [Geodermatophilus sp. TF02-6]RBY78801.1 hypothetical protein DQ238_12170 [Geodermatophilus sp. TF02-6]